MVSLTLLPCKNPLVKNVKLLKKYLTNLTVTFVYPPGRFKFAVVSNISPPHAPPVGALGRHPIAIGDEGKKRPRRGGDKIRAQRRRKMRSRQQSLTHFAVVTKPFDHAVHGKIRQIGAGIDRKRDEASTTADFGNGCCDRRRETRTQSDRRLREGVADGGAVDQF